jgi:hypothetical protein
MLEGSCCVTPEPLHVVKQALGVPMKRFERPMLGVLSHEAMQAIIGKPGTVGSARLALQLRL